MKISEKGLELIRRFEGLRLRAYKCPAGIATIGYGSTRGVKMGMVITPAEAEQRLREDVARFEADVMYLVKVKLTQGQFDALVSFAFNLGSDIDTDDIAEGLGDSTLLKLLNRGDYAGAAQQFKRWNKANGIELAGLTRRRAAEQALFEGLV